MFIVLNVQSVALIQLTLLQHLLHGLHSVVNTETRCRRNVRRSCGRYLRSAQNSLTTMARFVMFMGLGNTLKYSLMSTQTRSIVFLYGKVAAGSENAPLRILYHRIYTADPLGCVLRDFRPLFIVEVMAAVRALPCKHSLPDPLPTNQYIGHLPMKV